MLRPLTAFNASDSEITTDIWSFQGSYFHLDKDDKAHRLTISIIVIDRKICYEVA